MAENWFEAIDSVLASSTPTRTPMATPTPTAETVFDRWALWIEGTRLRGANIYQRRVYPELDGPDFMGHRPVGPPYTQEGFDRLAALGANYVDISHPGLFTLCEEESENVFIVSGIGFRSWQRNLTWADIMCIPANYLVATRTV